MTQTLQLIQDVNKAYEPIFLTKPRYVILMGGRGAGRSVVASQFALSKLTAEDYFRCAIMRYILGDIRNSIFQEIVDRAEEQQIDKKLTIKDHRLAIGYGQNLINGIGFKKSSEDQKSKLKSLASYNAVIIEEADEVMEEDFTQLDDSLRTIKSDIIIFLLLNPPSKNHWIIKRWFNLVPSEVEGFYLPVLKSTEKDTLFIHTTYLDNLSNLNIKTVENFERYKETRPDHYYNMIKGLVSEGARGRIYTNWKPISDEEFNKLPYPSDYGLDFGFSNHPTALIEIKEHNNQVYTKQLIYETGLTNQRIAKRMDELGLDKNNVIIYADSAEPKSIAELQAEGWTVLPSEKGPDSIKAGIDMLIDKEVYYTEGSKDIDTEQQEYRWALNKNKEPTNKPVDAFNHAMDAIRYVIFTKAKLSFVGFA
jgi:phage terminase large subunit